MKNPIIFISLLLGLILVACEDNKEQYLDQYSMITYFRNSGVDQITLYKTGVDGNYNVVVNKGGSNLETSTSVSVLVMDEVEVNFYNEQNSTDYKALPTDCYQMEGSALSFSPGETSKKIGVVLKTNAIDELMSAHPHVEYVLPLQLGESVDSINAQKRILMIQPTVLVPTIYFMNPGMQVIDYGGDGTDVLTYSFEVGMSLKNQWDFDCMLEVDKDALDVYNEQNGTDYELLNEDDYEIPTKLSFVSGKSIVQFDVKVDYSKLICGAYALPMKLVSVSNANFTVEENPCFLGIVYKAPRIPLTVDMLYCNRPEPGSDGKLESLLDNNINTFFNTQSSSPYIFDHYLEVRLKESVSTFQFNYTTRADMVKANPVEIVVKVSEDGNSFIDLESITQGLPTGLAMEYLSPILKSRTPVKYIRLAVTKTTHSSGRPYFGFSEFSFYGK